MAKKVILIILGALLTLCGIAGVCGGGALLGVGGSGGQIRSGYHGISTPTTAFVSDPTKVENSSNVRTEGGDTSLLLDGRNSAKPLFIGVGPTSQVDRFLAGSPYESITNVNFSPFRLTSTTVDGGSRPAAPGDQSFWVARATGADPQLRWKIADGDYKVVVMNADASQGLNLQARIGIKAPVLGGVGIGLLIGGIVVALGGIALLIWGIRTRRRNDPQDLVNTGGYTPAYPGTGGYPGSPYPGAGTPYPGSGGAPGSGGYPGTGSDPGSGGYPGSGTDPGSGGYPGTTPSPGSGGSDGPTTGSGWSPGGAQPGSGAQPGGGAQPGSGAQPGGEWPGADPTGEPPYGNRPPDDRT